MTLFNNLFSSVSEFDTLMTVPRHMHVHSCLRKQAAAHLGSTSERRLLHSQRRLTQKRRIVELSHYFSFLCAQKSIFVAS